MSSRAEVRKLLVDAGVIAVIRARRAEQVVPISEALLAGGVTAIEVTLTTPNALEAIAEACRKLGDRALVGVGTVLDPGQCRAAIDAGAEFVVSPILRPEIARAARDAERVVMLGAYTPTEAQLAYEAGSDFIKIFPADSLGPGYIRALRAPLPHLEIIPTGIARPEDVTAFIQAGCAAVGLGSLLIPADALKEERWDALTEKARQFVSLVHQARE